MPRYDATFAECLVYVFREGLLAAVGHDVCLRATRLTVEVEEDRAITAEIDATSLRLLSGGKSPADTQKIERHTADDVLAVGRYPLIVFRAAAVRRQGARAEVEGELTLHGVTRPLSFVAHDDGARWQSEVRLDQRDFGIRPFTAMLGALRVRPEVLVRLALVHR